MTEREDWRGAGTGILSRAMTTTGFRTRHLFCPAKCRSVAVRCETMRPQTLKAPGSTFKPITAIAGLEEGAITLSDMINCTGHLRGSQQSDPMLEISGLPRTVKCRGRYRKLLQLFLLGGGAPPVHRRQMEATNRSKGLETLKKYATMFGLDRHLGHRDFGVRRRQSAIRRSGAFQSIGQGTQLRLPMCSLPSYVDGRLPTGEPCLSLSLISQGDGLPGADLVKGYSPGSLVNRLISQTSTWDAVQQGMSQVVANRFRRSACFDGLDVDVAGKTGYGAGGPRNGATTRSLFRLHRMRTRRFR